MARRKGRFEKQKNDGSGMRIIVLLLVCVVIAAGVWLIIGKHAPEPETAESPVSDSVSLAATVPLMTAVDHYAPVLDKYHRAVAEGWTKDQCEIEGISLRMQAGADISGAGYALLDLDGDGREELLIAEQSLPHIDTVWDLYTTLEDGTPIQLWVDECDGNQCYLYEGNVIGVEFTGKNNAQYDYLKLDSGKLEIREILQYADGNWLRMEEDMKTESISQKQAMEITSSYVHQKLDLSWFADAPGFIRDSDTMERYIPVLEKYKTALLENWDMGQCYDNEISHLISWLAQTPEDLGVYYMYLDADSEQEMLIINVNDGTIYDMYTLKNGVPHKLISGMERNHYVLSTDNHIINRGSGSAFLSYFNDYVLYQGELVLVESVITDYQKDPDNPWFRSPDGETLGQPLTEQEAEAIFSGYETALFAATPVLDVK